MIRRAGLLACSMLAMPLDAVALSCLAPDPARSFNSAMEAEQSYIVVSGRFSFDAAALPQGDNSAETPPVAVPARFDGLGLTSEGFTTPLSMEVTLELSCLGPWCGSLDPDADHLAFLQRRVGGFHLELAPCPAWAFQDPSSRTLNLMQNCIRDEGCDGTP